MNYRLLFRHLGAVAFLIALGMVLCIPFGFSEIPGERDGLMGLWISIGITLAVGGALRWFGRHSTGELFLKEAIAVVVFSWFLVIFLGTFPYLFSGVSRASGVKMGFADAVFESVSGFTTTGSTVLSDLENPNLIPRCIVFWRSLTQFYGGIGILVLLVVVLTGRKSNRKNLANTEMSNIIAERPPAKIRKITGILFTIYVSFNVVLAAILFLAGVPPLDALCHAFGTIATGGFSTYNAGAEYFAGNADLNVPLIEWSITIFCLLGATNFMLFYWCAHGKPGILFRNEEWRTFLGIYLAVCLLILVGGLCSGDFDALEVTSDTETSDTATSGTATSGERASFEQSVRYVFFNTASLLTTTGYCTDDFSRWNGLSRFLLFTILFIGGCAGSTAGSVKVIRYIVCWKMIRRAAETTYRPNIVRPVFANGMEFDRERQTRIVLYIVTYLFFFVLATILILVIEPASQWERRNSGTENTATAENTLGEVVCCVASTLSGAGPSCGIVGPDTNFGAYSDPSKYVFCCAMLLGRLEIFVVLAVLFPGFWGSPKRKILTQDT